MTLSRLVRHAAGLAAALLLAGPASADNAFLNLSSRGRVDAGENVLVGGLVVETRSNVLIRGMGPSLGALGIAQPLAHARLTLFDRHGTPLATNADWRLAIPATLDPAQPPFPGYDAEAAPSGFLVGVMDALGAFPPEGHADAALYAELEPGIYTVHLAADDAAPGVGLLEIYLVPEEIDPFAPAGRVRTAPDAGYAPPRDGYAPASPLPEAGVRSLVLEFDSPITWTNNSITVGPASTASIPFEATGTRDPRHGRVGATDSRGWLVSPRYTKTGADTATVDTLASLDASYLALQEQVLLTFTSPTGGTFTYTWGAHFPGIDPPHGSGSGTFTWTRRPPDTLLVPGSRFFPVHPRDYSDRRPSTSWALRVSDHGPVLRHGSGPDASDINGAREPIVTAVDGGFVMHYDGCAVGGWRACRAVSTDLVHWELDGPILPLGAPGSIDAGTVASPWTFLHAGTWHMYYLATPDHTGPPDYIPFLPYYTRLATAPSLLGPWTKQPAAIPFDPAPGTFYAKTAAPGQVIAHGGEFLQYFSAAADSAGGVLQRTLGLARTDDPAGSWTINTVPLLPPAEQIENSALYFEPANGLWFLFTNHVGITPAGGEFTDEIWVYWSADPTSFDAARKAVVLDPGRSSWSKWVIGMPTVVRVGDRLALLHDGRAAPGHGHMQRDIGLAWIDLPLSPPF